MNNFIEETDDTVMCMCFHSYEEHDTKTYEDASPCNFVGCECTEFEEDRK